MAAVRGFRFLKKTRWIESNSYEAFACGLVHRIRSVRIGLENWEGD